MKLNRDDLLMILKYYSYMNDKFIVDLDKYDTDELRKLIKFYHIDINEDIDEELLQNVLEWYDTKQGVIDKQNMKKKLQGYLMM
jgi:hypothetical protein